MTPIFSGTDAAAELRFRAAGILLHSGLSPIAAKAFVEAMVATARKIPGDAAFGDQTALADLADFLMAANEAQLSTGSEEEAI